MKYICFVLFTVSLFACNETMKSANNDTWTQVFEGDEYEIGLPTGFINSKGDTVIPFGKYQYIFTDTFKTMAIVFTQEGKCIGIDKEENELFEVYWFDNGPDYVQDGLFRIKKDDKVGYANEAGDIIIEPQYKCTTPFENGQARVAVECDLVEDGEYTRMENAKWLTIDTEGQEVSKTK